MKFKKTAETLPKGAHTLERDYYMNPSILQREYNNIFFKNWICAGRSSELTEVGQYKIINIDTESVIVLRENNGALKAHFNVCRHRGTRICKKRGWSILKINSMWLPRLDLWIGW